MATALVLGATGHIGAHCVRALLAAGHTVRAAYRREAYLAVLDGVTAERVPVDLDQPATLKPALQGVQWVFYAGGYYPRLRTPRAVALEKARLQARRVFEVLAAAGVQKVVFTSSAATIQRVSGRAATEVDAFPGEPPQALSVYAAAKVVMEHEALRAYQAGLPVVVVNPSICIGEYDLHRFSGLYLLAYAQWGLPFYLEHTANFVYTGDVGRGHVLAAERGCTGERYLLSAEALSMQAWISLIRAKTGKPRVVWRLPHHGVEGIVGLAEAITRCTGRAPLLPRQAVAHLRVSSGLDASKAKAEWGWMPIKVEQAVDYALAWYRAQGWL